MVEPLSTTTGILAAVGQDPKLAYDPNLTQSYLKSGGALSDGAIPIQNINNAPKPLGIISSDGAINTLNKTNDRLASLQGTPLSQTTNQQGGTNGTTAPAPATTPSSKVTLVNPDTGQSSTFDDASINQSNIQALLNSGYKVSETSGNIPSWLVQSSTGTSTETPQSKAQKELDDAGATVKGLTSDLTKYTVSDADLQGQIRSISAAWDTRIRQMEQINKARIGSVNTLGIRLGSQYAGGAGGQFGSIVTAEETEAVSRIGDLESKKQEAISAAKQAARDQNWKVYSKQVDMAEKFYDDKMAALKELNAATKEQNKLVQERLQKAQDNLVRSSRDSAISGLIEQGITDPTKILSTLNFDEQGNPSGDFTFKEINDITEKMKQTEKVAPGIIGEWVAAKKEGAIDQNTTLEQYLSIKDPTRALDLQEQRLRIAKIQKDLSENGVSGDPSSILAYANQYAATGQIPPGIPKGTFGVIANAAKELPKNDGEVVDNITNIHPAKVTSAVIDGFGAMRDITKKLEEAKPLFDKINTGLLGGTLGWVFPSQDRQAYFTLRGEIVDLLARARSGAALTASEEQMYKAKIPDSFNKTLWLGNNGENNIDNLRSSISGKLDSGLKAHGTSMYGFSKIKIGGQEYTVGDIVTNSKGESGRVLPDGSISTL